VIVPSYNEEACLAETVFEIRSSLTAAGIGFEIVIVDDGSSDATPEISEDLSQRPDTRVHRLEQNSGMGAAMRAGIQAARGEWICFLPADGQFPATELVKLYLKRDGADAIAGEVSVRERAQADDLLRVILSKGLRFSMRLAHPRMPKFNGILLVRRSLVIPMSLVGATGFVHLEILDRIRRTKRDFVLRYEPIDLKARTGGTSKTANVKTILAVTSDILRLRKSYWLR
jgi:glycosyltransferase involved in cell wall biosynthesis